MNTASKHLSAGEIILGLLLAAGMISFFILDEGGTAEDPVVADRRLVESTVRDVARYVVKAEAEYRKATGDAQAGRGGDAGNRALADGAWRIDAIRSDLQRINLSTLHNQEAKKALEQAIFEFRAHYLTKANYLMASYEIIRDGDYARGERLVAAYKERVNELKMQTLRGTMSLSFAKQEVGLPSNLPAFGTE